METAGTAVATVGTAGATDGTAGATDGTRIVPDDPETAGSLADSSGQTSGIYRRGSLPPKCFTRRRGQLPSARRTTLRVVMLAPAHCFSPSTAPDALWFRRRDRCGSLRVLRGPRR